MYSYFRGYVTEVHATHIVFEVSNVGYKIRVPNPYQFELNVEQIIYLHYHVREDGISLFGFKTKQEQNLFLRLINVSGIGPKTASGILGATTTNSLITAIELGNIAFLKKLPSIGPKAAQQIILDLKGKLISVEDANKPSAKKSETYSDVYDALRQFGFKVSEIDNVINKIESIEMFESGFSSYCFLHFSGSKLSRFTQKTAPRIVGSFCIWYRNYCVLRNVD